MMILLYLDEYSVDVLLLFAFNTDTQRARFSHKLYNLNLTLCITNYINTLNVNKSIMRH